MEKKKAEKEIFEDVFLGRGEENRENQQSPEEKAETAIAELRNRYSEKVREQYENEVKKLREERDAALRENWILQQKAEAALPEKLAAAGINGGAAASEITDIMAQYQGNRNEIRSDYLDGILKAGSESRKEIFENEKDFNKEWIEYLLELAKAEGK